MPWWKTNTEVPAQTDSSSDDFQTVPRNARPVLPGIKSGPLDIMPTNMPPANEPLGELGRGAQVKQPAPPDVIVKIEDLPLGADVTNRIGFPEDALNHVAVVYSGTALEPGAQVVLLCDEQHYASPMMFDARRRIERGGFSIAKTVPCSSEMLKALHLRDAADSTVLGAVSDIKETDAERIFKDIVNEAVEMHASDIHIETRGTKADVYFRIHGARMFIRNLSFETAAKLASVSYTVYAAEDSKAQSWDRNQVMDGAIDFKTNRKKSVQLRFSSSPIHPAGNFQIVMRVLEMDPDRELGLDELGYEPQQVRAIETMVTGASGMVLLCGPTNSGKSSSLAAMVRTIFNRRGRLIKVITVEDPVERVLEGACQIGVPAKKAGVDENPYARFLKGVLRQDPDVCMIGEIRDSESADIVKDFVLAGRKLLTTLHSYSALGAFVRLSEIGVPKSLLTMPGFISGIIYQRLVPTLCPHCSISIRDPEAKGRIPADVLNRVTHVCDIVEDNVRVRGDGCHLCNSTGISGRTVVAEFVMPDQKLLAMIAADQNIAAYEHWRDAKVLSVGRIGVTALAHAILKMKRGLLDPMDVETQVDTLTKDMVMADSVFMEAEVDVALGETAGGVAFGGWGAYSPKTGSVV